MNFTVGVRSSFSRIIPCSRRSRRVGLVHRKQTTTIPSMTVTMASGAPTRAARGSVVNPSSTQNGCFLSTIGGLRYRCKTSWIPTTTAARTVMQQFKITTPTSPTPTTNVSSDDENSTNYNNVIPDTRGIPNDMIDLVNVSLPDK